MKLNPLFLHRRFLFTAALFAALAWPLGVRAQDTPQITEIEIDGGKDEPPAKKVSLRPNAPINLGFELKNRTPDTLRDVVVKVVQIVGAEERLLATANVKEIAPTAANARGEVVLAFDKIKGAEKPPEKGAAEKIETFAPPYKLQIQIEAKAPKGFPVTKRNVALVVRQPRDYVGATATFDQINKRLLVGVTYPKAEDLFGPHKFPVQLTLSPNLKTGKKGLYKDMITSPNQVGDLRADFEQLIGEGEAYVKVDNYDRAYTFPVKLGAPGAINALPRDEIRVRIQVPRFAKPSAKFEVLLETDGPLTDDYRVKIALDRTGERTRFRDEIELIGLRQQRAIFDVSKSKNLFCQVDVSDWRPQFDISDVFSDVYFRVNVWQLDAKKKVFEKVKVTFPEGNRAYLAPIEADDDSRNLYVRVSLDESKPEDLQFVNLPKEWPASNPLEVKLKIRERKAPQAPVGKVIFFRGRAPKDDKTDIRDEDILAVIENPDPKKSEFSFVLPPQIKVEPVVISAQVITRNGVKATHSEGLNITAASASKGLYKIKGKVVNGEIPQPKLPVLLFDAKKKEKTSEGATDENGNFVFNDVPPGAYVVASVFAFRNLDGRTAVEISNADKTDVLIKLGPKKGK